MSSRIEHWNTIYKNKKEDQVSWTQERPTISLDFVEQLTLDLQARIIDVGCGKSYFPDHLIDLGYKNLTLLDISETAIEHSRNRLSSKADLRYVVSDITTFNPSQQYDLWYDRAVFHFLTIGEEIKSYVQLVSKAIPSGGYLLLGTFSTSGPLKCSGLEITQYSEESMTNLLQENFEPIRFVQEQHKTPFDSEQAFIFGLFRRK